jgi:DNA adenine methylase
MNYLERELLTVASAHRTYAEPFLKWAGGKRWLFKRYRHLFPEAIDRLVDPFVGGGSSFFYLKPKQAILSDLNGDLVDLYVTVRDRPRSLTRRLVRYHHAHSKEFYYSVRETKPEDRVRRAAWLLYLNRTCWNGLFRVNLQGKFNVPIGTKTKIFSSLDELDAASQLLRNAKLRASDFEVTIDSAQKGDLVFADPPYFEKNANVRFLKYTSNIFSWPDQLRLRDALLRAARRGAICFVTNANHRSLLQLYADCGVIHQITRHSVVSGPAHGRRLDREILVEIK